MSRIAGIALGALAAIAAVAAYESFFIVDEREQAIVLQFGEPRRVVREPGLQFKIPFIQNITVFDRRILLFDNPVEEIIVSDQKRLIVDAFARYRIVDPPLFFQTIRFEVALRTRLGSIITDSLRQVLGEVPLQSVISDERAALMSAVADGVRRQARRSAFTSRTCGSAGRIFPMRTRGDLPPHADRAPAGSCADPRRGRGRGPARACGRRSRQDGDSGGSRTRRGGVAGAGRSGEEPYLCQRIRQDPEFFAFYRSMQAYQNALTADDTTMVLSPRSQFFQFFGTDAVAPPE